MSCAEAGDAVREHALHQLHRALEFAILQRVEDRVAMREVLIQRADADAGDFGDARRRRGVRPFSIQNPSRRVENGRHGRARTRLLRLFS